MPAGGLIKYDYLTPGGFYKQMWDWDGFFIGMHLATRSEENVKYLKWWALNFLHTMDEEGYVCGCISQKELRQLSGKFSMKPFLAQGCYYASVYSGEFEWIRPIYDKMKKVIAYREKTQFDEKYGLFFWENAMHSGADNNPAISNEEDDRNAILACDMNTFQLREYVCMAKICSELGFTDDEQLYKKKVENLNRAINKQLWFAESDSFFNIRRDTGKPVRRISYSNFLPLVNTLASVTNGKRMIKRYLWNSDHMLSDFGIRTLSKQDKDYNNENTIIPYSNWQGPVWPIANFLYSVALKNYGFKQEAKHLAHTISTLCLDDIRECGSMHENYHAETGEPLAPAAEHSPDGIFRGIIGWNLLVQNMLEGAYNGKGALLSI